MNSPMPIPSSSRIGSPGSSVDDRLAAQASPDASGRDGFGRHFDTARRQDGHKADAEATSSPSSASASDAKKARVSPDSAASASKSSDTSGKDDTKSDDKTEKPGDAQSLAAIMLDLFGAAKQSLPKSAPGASVAGANLGKSDSATATATAAVAVAAWPMAIMVPASGDMAEGVVDAAAQTIADGAAGDTAAAEGDGAKAAPGGLAAILAATTLQAVGSMAHAPGGGSLAPQQDNQSTMESMAMNGLAASLTQGAAPAAHALNIAAPAGGAPFAQELGQQIIWLGGQTLKQANIRLNPEQLGSLDVKVSVTHDGHVDVSFTAQHPAAVTAVQQSLGQLDLMLAGQGLSLGQAQVGQQGAGYQGGGSGQRDATGETDLAIDSLAPAVRHAISVGLLDTFA